MNVVTEHVRQDGIPTKLGIRLIKSIERMEAEMERERSFNGQPYKYFGSEKNKSDAEARVKRTGKAYRITKYGSGYGSWGTGYDIWVREASKTKRRII
jgi:hypothetical protein